MFWLLGIPLILVLAYPYLPKRAWIFLGFLGLIIGAFVILVLANYHPYKPEPTHTYLSCPKGEADMGKGCVKLQPYNYPYPHSENGT